VIASGVPTKNNICKLKLEYSLLSRAQAIIAQHGNEPKSAGEHLFKTRRQTVSRSRHGRKPLDSLEPTHVSKKVGAIASILC
jgi:hypothetical protein